MPNIEIRDEDGNTVRVNTATGETTLQPANILDEVIWAARTYFVPPSSDK